MMNSTLAQSKILQDRYQVVTKITTAGQSNVYKVIDLKNARQELALKEMLETLMPPETQAQAREQFHQQAHILGGLRHPNLLKIIESFSERGRDYLVMEFIQGSTLEETFQAAPIFLEERRVIAWAIQLCDVLDYLHSQKEPIIFRDIKPANIMLDKTGVIKLIDFGIARMFSPVKRTDTLKMGSLGYAPPEQYKGRGQTDERADIYALGATMHHLLTRRDPQDEPPFSFFQAMPRDVRPELSIGIERVIMKAVEYDKNNRQSSAKEFKTELLACSVASVRPSSSFINAKKPRPVVRNSNVALQPVVKMPLRQQSRPQQAPVSSAPPMIPVLPVNAVSAATPTDMPRQDGKIARSFLWIYSVIAGFVLGVVSCPLIIALSLIEGALKGAVIGVLVGGSGLMASRVLANTYGIFMESETWVFVGVGFAALSVIVSPIAHLIRAPKNLSLYEKYIHHGHGRYAGALGSVAVLLVIAYLGIEYTGKTAPFITRYMEYLWNLLVSCV